MMISPVAGIATLSVFRPMDLRPVGYSEMILLSTKDLLIQQALAF